MIAPKFENVDVKNDIRDFIHATRGNKIRVGLTVNDLCNDTTRSLMSSPSSKPCRPLRKTCLEIRDISSKKVPFDYDGNQELLSEALGIYRPRAPGGMQNHQRQEVHDHELSSRDGYARLRINCSMSSTENDFVADTDITTSVEPAPDSGIDAELEDKSSIAQQNEPEHDSDEHSPSVSPSATSSSLMTHYSSHDQEAEFMAAQHDSTLVSKET